MTDRINALTVFLERDIREDDIEPLLTAIRMLRGVLSIEPHVVDAVDQVIAHNRAVREIQDKVLRALGLGPD